jgi:hypothetical protein
MQTPVTIVTARHVRLVKLDGVAVLAVSELPNDAGRCLIFQRAERFDDRVARHENEARWSISVALLSCRDRLSARCCVVQRIGWSRAADGALQPR